jgi:alkanesulfonate monooxygenase SsuD/methylene tetrahydromethanopterin reductase-like flavin-dependent oxidoreductase (luciferase family)
LWYGVHSVESAAETARLGINVVSFEKPDNARAVNDSYRRSWRELHGDAEMPKVGLLRFVFVADTDEKALEIARRAYRRWHSHFHYLFRLHGTGPRTGARAPEFDGVIAEGRGIAGSPRTVARFLRDQMAHSHANYFVGQFAFGDLTLAETLASIDLFRRHVMPELVSAEFASAN